MSRHQVMIQMFVDGRAIWRVTEPIAPEIASRMTDDELRVLGSDFKNHLARLIAARPAAEKPASEKVQAAVKKVVAAVKGKKKAEPAAKVENVKKQRKF